MRKLYVLLAAFGIALLACGSLSAMFLPEAPTGAARAMLWQSPTEPAPQPEFSQRAGPEAPAHASEKRITSYTLPPDMYKKAHTLSQIAFWGEIATFIYSLVILWLFLQWRLGPKYRDWTERASSVRFLQAVIFAPLFLATVAILDIPTDIGREWVLRKYGLSIQNWGSWLWDWTKGELISIAIGIILIWILYAVIRKSRRRWWFYFWLAALPIGLFLVFLQPVVIDPMFHKFEPLAQKDPGLTTQLERMVQRAGEKIPPERMYWMGAGEKTTALNAYVTGFGASKRLVVWDTTIAKMTTPEIVFVAGHEMGHYVLNHIPKGLAFFAVFLAVLLYLGSRSIGWLLAKWGPRWQIRGLDDWASLPALLLLLSIFVFIASPIGNSFSRHIEHQADQYGLEVTHGLTPDSSQVAAQAFQVLGEVDLADPKPNPVDVFFFYDHPAIPNRIRFCLTYDPWVSGSQPEFVK